MNSIRIRLFVILLLATGVVWLSAFVWIQQSTRAEVTRVLDARLAEAGQMVSSLISDRRIDVASAATIAADQSRAENPAGAEYSHKLSCQIWSLDGALVGASGGAPAGQLSALDEGFADSMIDGEEWRVYSVVNQELGVRVMVGDSHKVRDRLVRDVTTGLILPALLILPVLAGLIWLSLRRGLRPLDRLARGLSRRTADDLDPVGTSTLPDEIAPVATAINGLFGRVSAARDREKAFTSFAAHELKTPLAGIKTQAQVAMMAPDDATRAGALDRIQQGVARTDRMVRQLLSLASVDRAERQQETAVDVMAIIHDIIDELARTAAARDVTLTVSGEGPMPVRSDAVLLTVALRNIIENAIAVAPDASEVEITVERQGARLTIHVADRGPGIDEADRAHVTDRFFRGGSANTNGSGLGLAIVKTATERLGGRLEFSPRPGGGEVVSLNFDNLN